MNENEIKKLIKIVEDSEIDQLEVSRWGKKIKITRRIGNGNGHPVGHPVLQMAPPLPVAAVPAVSAAAPVSAATPIVDSAPPSADKNYIEIKSPMVGTFYAAPAPDAPDYTKVGDKVSVGQIVCIIEAMKLMNEIEAEISGTVSKILVENSQPVEFGQVLFLIDPAG
ncbi:MAG: acetyl-CoA carboxylase biotin carboxyl carrier protein [candidate division Zixibacteria bacterium]